MKPITVEMQAFGPFASRQVIDFRRLGKKTFFLIHGSTGAGKTSILDAMCFALFGDSSGGEREGHQMRSHHAEAGLLTQVTFEFALGERYYRVLRIPDQDRPARRGGGETRQLQKAELHRLETDTQGRIEELPLATGWRKVTEEVVRLLGFESRQFRQVIMLPQGQFFDFLKSTSQEREKILQTLFGTEIFRRIEERLSRKAREVEDEARNSNTRRETLLGQAEVPNEAALDERLQAIGTQLQTAHAEEARCREAERAAESLLTTARQLADRFGEFDKAAVAFGALKGQEPSKALVRRDNERARAALVVLPHVTAASRAAAQATLEARSLAEFQTQERATVADSTKADEALARANQRAPEIEELNRERIRLDELAARVQTLQTARSQLAGAQAQLGQATAAHAAAEKTLQQALADQATASASLQTAQLQAARVEGLRARLTLLQGQATKAAALRKAEADANTAQRDLQSKSSALQAAGRAESKAREVRDLTHRAWVAGQAARLAAGLMSDQACPVCGSAHHPSPARPGSDAGDAIVHDDVLNAAETSLRTATELHHAARLKHDEAVQLSQSLRTRMDELRSDLAEVTSTATDLGQAVLEVQSELKTAEDATTRLPTAQARLASADAALARAQHTVSQTTAQVQAAAASHQQCLAVLTERQQAVPPELSTPDQLEQARTRTVLQLEELTKVREDARTAASRAHEALASARARVQAAQEALARMNQERDATARIREVQLNAAGFTDLQAFEAARMDEAQLAKSEEDLRRFDTDLAAAQQRHDRAIADLVGQTRPELPTLVAAHEQAKAAHLAASNTVRDVLAAQQAAARLAADLKTQALDYQRLQARYAVVKRVSDLANGVGGQRMSFQRYVLSTLLEEVLAATTQRLQVMSKGRYELRRAATSDDRRAAAGLDLEAFDHYTGTLRPVSTLSGGESFLTSLALALGLSDVVQAYAGGIRLDAIFVDEGFGTLDTEALDFAIRALKDLQQTGRMVGIISHVTELREWIDARLEVRAGASGSVAEFVV